MSIDLRRRQFIQLALAGGAVHYLGARPSWARQSAPPPAAGPRARIARLYLGAEGHWPKPDLDLAAEKKRYDDAFASLADQLDGVDFITDQIVTSPDQAAALKDTLATADGVLLIHLKMGVTAILQELLAAGRPTMLFAAPYSGHEWATLGALQKQPLGANLCAVLTSDLAQLATAVRPLRAIHHLKATRILNVTTRPPSPYVEAVRQKFGTEIHHLGLEPLLALYNAVPDDQARAEAEKWTREAVAVVEPPADEILKSCRLALAFEALLRQEQANMLTVDCYGTMYQPLCKTHAFPCIGFTRLNDMGLGGICESDLECAMTCALFQGLAGKPGFISDPTMDESQNGIILAHCLGTRKMDGPKGEPAPYKIRTIMERQEGAVPQVFMRVGERVTNARLTGLDRLPYFTGKIVDAPDLDRGCRTKITVQLPGDATRLWQGWAPGLHRVTCYTDLSRELAHFCRFMGITMTDEAA